MLALPVSTAAVGFGNSIIFLFLCWLIMTAGALLILEVNMRMPRGSNMVSMAKSTLGLPGQILTWVTYLFLLYTLLAAYISGGSDVFSAMLNKFNLHLPDKLTSLIFTGLFGFVVYNGIRSVDFVNRGLMFGKLGIYLLLVLIISPHVSVGLLKGGSSKAITGSLMILVASFSFASIVPSLRDYFEDDVRALRKVIIVGSMIPLFCYVLWNAVIMGVIGREGEHGLMALTHSDHATSGLTESLSLAVNNDLISAFFAFFTSICMLTAFLGVSLGLFDFLADGLKLEKKGNQGHYTLALTFLPPLVVVLLSPGVYLKALNYAGVACIILLLFLPAVMAWRARKTCNGEVMPMIPGGNLSLALLVLCSVLLLFVSF